MSPENSPSFICNRLAAYCGSMPSSLFFPHSHLCCTFLHLFLSLSHTHAYIYTPIHRKTDNQIRTQDTSIQKPKQAEIPKIPLVPEAVRHPTLNSSFTVSLQGTASSHHQQQPTQGGQILGCWAHTQPALSKCLPTKTATSPPTQRLTVLGARFTATKEQVQNTPPPPCAD